MPIKAYKGFNKDMTCRGFQFKEGESYKEPEAKLCKSGFHACLNPIDCFYYYSPATSEFHEVELDDVSDEHGDDTKVCSKKIKIGAKLDVLGACKAHFEYVKSRCKVEKQGPDNTQSAARNRSSLAARNRSSLSAQDWSSLSAQDGSSLAAQSHCKLSAGSNSAIVAFDSIAKAGLNSIICLANRSDRGDIVDFKCGVVDGETLKPDTWYKLENGEFVECEEDAE